MATFLPLNIYHVYSRVECFVYYFLKLWVVVKKKIHFENNKRCLRLNNLSKENCIYVVECSDFKAKLTLWDLSNI